MTSSRDVKQRLREEALELMSERGYDGVSVRDICKAAGVNANAITYHFGGKDGLFSSLMEGLTDDIYEIPFQILKSDCTTIGEFRLCLTLFFEETLRQMLKNRRLIILISQECRCQDEKDLFKVFHKNIQDFLERGVAQSIVNPNLDPAFVTGVFMDRIFVQVVSASHIKHNHGVDINNATYRKEWIQKNMELFLHGLINNKERE